MKHITSCNICGASKFTPYAVSVDPNILHSTYARCTGCGIYFANPMCTPEELGNYYSNHFYADSHDKLIQAIPRMAEEHKKTTIVEIKQHLHTDTTVQFLDIGCGYGPVLIAAKEHGFKVTGIELSNSARHHCIEELKLDVRATPLDACEFPSNSFDVVFAWHVIEHVDDLAAWLNEIHRILKPNGIFYFGTENYRSLPILISRLHHLMTGSLPCLNTADEHTFLFTPGLVRSILPRFGFNVLSVKTYQPWHKFKPFAQSIRDDDGQLPKRIIKATTYQLVRLLADKIPSRGDHLKAVTIKR